MDVAGALLKLILLYPEESLEQWSKLKLCYFSSIYTSIYSNISKFYKEHSRLPSLSEVELLCREPTIRASIAAIKTIEIPEDIDKDILVEALINDYTQNETLTKLDEFIDDIQFLSSSEIKAELANIVLYIEEKTANQEDVCLMSDFQLYYDDGTNERVALGINDVLDSKTGGFQLTDLIMIGGRRGSGKSLVGCNIVSNQYSQGNVGLFFSIEQPGIEIYDRIMSILSGVSHDHIRNKTLDPIELLKLAEVKASFFADSQDILNQYKESYDFKKFERDLINYKKLKESSQIIIIDNQKLTMSEIDLHIYKTKAKFGDKLKVVVVDYVNKIIPPDILNGSQFDWKLQVDLSNQLKGLARKHKVCIVSPYQIDSSGEARFAKGLLDAPDASFILEAGQDFISFETTKSRSFAAISFKSMIDWNCLKIFPDELIENEDKLSSTRDIL